MIPLEANLLQKFWNMFIFWVLILYQHINWYFTKICNCT